MSNTTLILVLMCALLVTVVLPEAAADGENEPDATAGPYCVDVKTYEPTDPVDVYECD